MERSSVVELSPPGAAGRSDIDTDAVPLPAHRRDLIYRPTDDEGSHVVKDPVTGEYFELGPQESFLLKGLDGRTTAGELRAAFTRRFDEALSDEDLSGFLDLARRQGFLQASQPAAAAKASDQLAAQSVASAAPSSVISELAAPRRPRQSILYWRKRVFDPDHLFNVLAPHLRFIWTRGFFALSAIAIVAAVPLVWANRFDLVTRFAGGMSWEVLLIAWLTLITVTTCHEFAHGLTCKHYGGEVHEVGFLLMYFTPCFYCNVSDAWLFREKSKRLWVTFAGAWCDLIMWALAVIVWRLTLQDTVVNYLAWIVLSVCGARIFFNFNPLLKLDGYYLLSDAIGLSNLRQRSWDAAAGWLRRWLWGAPRPAPEPRGRFLLWFGLTSWWYSFIFLALMLWALFLFAGGRWGAVGQVAAAGMGAIIMTGLFRGLCRGEVTAMIRHRRGRVMIWTAAVLVIVAALAVVPYKDQASGALQLRSAARAEVRAPVAGFVRAVRVREGGEVGTGNVVAILEVPELDNRIATTRAGLAEAQARLTMTEAGPRVSSAETLREREIRVAEMAVARASVARLNADLQHLQAMAEKQTVCTSVAGVVATPHLDEKVGEFVKEGDLICTVEGGSSFLAEVALPEDRVGHVRPGQPLKMKIRAMPFDTFYGHVERVAPVATTGPVQGTVTVYCSLDGTSPALRAGMTGEARITCGRRPAGVIFIDRTLRLLRTEFWW